MGEAQESWVTQRKVMCPNQAEFEIFDAVKD